MDEINGSGSGSENDHNYILFVFSNIVDTVDMKKLKRNGKEKEQKQE